jgi:hypothetical protein
MAQDEKKCPFPWFGGKTKAADTVWSLIGDVHHYVEPFCGGMAVLLNRPHTCNRPYYSETVCDKDGLLVNAWRAIQWYPIETARAASWPVSEADKQARQIAMKRWVSEDTLALLAGSPDWCDPVMAGWWLYGVACQIGGLGGPWTADPKTGRIRKIKDIAGEYGPDWRELRDDSKIVSVYMPACEWEDDTDNEDQIGTGVLRGLPHLGNDGQGVEHAGMREVGVQRISFASDTSASDIFSTNPFHDHTMPGIIRWMQLLSARIRHVRIVNGDWKRVTTGGAAKTLPVRQGHGPAGIFIDPPYSFDVRSADLYMCDCTKLAEEVREWCIKNGNDPEYRIVLAGFDGEHNILESMGWRVYEWYKKGHLTGGMGNIDGTSQQHKERLWASPQCLVPGAKTEPKTKSASLFGDDERGENA